MSGSMSQDDLVADLKNSLHDAADIFTAAGDADYIRHLDMAALGLTRWRPRTLVGTIDLVADTALYTAPDDLSAIKSHLWGIAPLPARRPWEKGYTGRLPDLRLTEVDGVRALCLEPSPTAAQIGMLGSSFRYYYFARHSVAVSADQTTIRAGDRGLLLLRAQAEAMREMAMRNIKKPVQMRDGLASAPKNGTPTALYQVLMEEFERVAA